jgi:hypothetical protein
MTFRLHCMSGFRFKAATLVDSRRISQQIERLPGCTDNWSIGGQRDMISHRDIHDLQYEAIGNPS